MPPAKCDQLITALDGAFEWDKSDVRIVQRSFFNFTPFRLRKGDVQLDCGG
jgi:hypothetical protein